MERSRTSVPFESELGALDAIVGQLGLDATQLMLDVCFLDLTSLVEQSKISAMKKVCLNAFATEEICDEKRAKLASLQFATRR